MGVLSNLEPASVFYYFEEICGIPHTSHHEKALSDYCVQFAKAHGLSCRQDEMGNVLIKAPATPGYEKEPGLILQGHLDMVGDKTADCPLDLEKDAIHPVVDGGYVCAEGTTLGGDDGIAVAYALAVLDAKDIPHPALEVVLTVCEEVGLLGASAMDFSDLEGRILVNIDSEEEGVLTAGCAGGRRVECHLPITRAAVTGTAVKADIAGLAGGHSGTEIHKGRANAIALLGRYLTLLSDHGAEYAVLTLSGGAKENVIPKESSVTLVLPAGITEAVRAAGADFTAQMKAEFGTADPGIRLQLTEEGCGEYDALDANSAERLRKALLLMPWGVQSMSMDVPGLVETSLNLGVAEMDEQRSHPALFHPQLGAFGQGAAELQTADPDRAAGRQRAVPRRLSRLDLRPRKRPARPLRSCVRGTVRCKAPDRCHSCGPGMRHPLRQNRRAGLHLLRPEPAACPHPQRARRHCIGGPCVGIPEGYSGL